MCSRIAWSAVVPTTGSAPASVNPRVRGIGASRAAGTTAYSAKPPVAPSHRRRLAVHPVSDGKARDAWAGGDHHAGDVPPEGDGEREGNRLLSLALPDPDIHGIDAGRMDLEEDLACTGAKECRSR